MRSPWGRVLRSIREDEEAVRSLGKNVFAYKMQALILGGVFGGLAGITVALRQASVAPDDFSTDVTFYAYVVLLLGGAARVLGPVVGALIFWFLFSGLGTFFTQAVGDDAGPLIPDWLMDAQQASLVRLVLLGLGLMLLMIYRPQGIFGDRGELRSMAADAGSTVSRPSASARADLAGVEARAGRHEAGPPDRGRTTSPAPSVASRRSTSSTWRSNAA
jgi:branched-chain amino acid transport system permease protein